MDEPQSPGAEREFLPLTDSLVSRIRWRACDYADLFSAELELMLSCGPLSGTGPMPGLPELHSGIRLFQCDPYPLEDPVQTAAKTGDSETLRLLVRRSLGH